MDISVIKNLGKWMKVRMNIENAQNSQKLSCAFKLVRNGNSKEKCCYSNSKNRETLRKGVRTPALFHIIQFMKIQQLKIRCKYAQFGYIYIRFVHLP